MSDGLLSIVRIADSVVSSCFTHALVTEKEEIMGVLLGDVFTCADGTLGAKIWDCFPLERSVQQRDRVEIAAESLIEASTEAERLSSLTGQRTRVVGWYHSHPHITPFPSTVDLNSQKMYQQMEQGWVGLIVSAFHSDPNGRNDCSVHCFQTGPGNSHIQVPIEIHTQNELGIPIEHTLPCSYDRLFNMLQKEFNMAVATVDTETNHDSAALQAALGLSRAQLFMMRRLVVEPVAKYMEFFSVPQLEAILAFLESRAN